MQCRKSISHSILLHTIVITAVILLIHFSQPETQRIIVSIPSTIHTKKQTTEEPFSHEKSFQKKQAQQRNTSLDTTNYSSQNATRDDLYLSEISRMIQEEQVYPPAAFRRNQGGTCVITLSISADGTPSEVHLKKSSGFESLDYEALQSLKRIRRFPPPPDQLVLKGLEIPIQFLIRR